jgi:protein-S-isoprenylcysteine O-methyltransferase Ste14
MLILRTLIFTLLFPGTVVGWAPALLLRSGLPRLPFVSEWLRWAGLGLMVVGAAGYVWCAGEFVARGRGTPAPWDAPERLVGQGLYRFSRNPMYVSLLLVLLGEAFWFGSLLLLGYALFIGLCFHLRVLRYEEPTLRRQFGAAYEAYCRSVPRWLPGLRRRGG